MLDGNQVHQGILIVSEKKKIIAINDFDGKYSIYTTSAIYQFDDTNENYGNKWNYEHGNVGS